MNKSGGRDGMMQRASDALLMHFWHSSVFGFESTFITISSPTDLGQRRRLQHTAPLRHRLSPQLARAFIFGSRLGTNKVLIVICFSSLKLGI